MKRIHLFEFEDFPWFPNWIRELMTRYIQTFHKVLKTSDLLTPLVEKGLSYSSSTHILDLCSGSGGPMIEVLEKLKEKEKFADLQLTLTDLYPNQKAIKKIKRDGKRDLDYLEASLDATKVDLNLRGLRTMVSGLHHMRSEVAKLILQNAKVSQQPILIFEISDNSAPIFLWWLAIPVAFITSLFVTPMVRPMSVQQLIFTYLIPILPLFIAWDGAVSNARTYTLEDMEELIKGLSDEKYQWEMGKVPGRGGNKLYLLGKAL
jgi:ubiquinone/menaquinone biosynthesis C-methylase UbiE